MLELQEAALADHKNIRELLRELEQQGERMSRSLDRVELRGSAIRRSIKRFVTRVDNRDSLSKG